MWTGGYLYAIGAEGTTFVKIGCARNIERRLKELQTAQPFSLFLIARVRVAVDMRSIERKIHDFLAEKLHRGEWFNISMDAEQLLALAVRAGAVLDHTTGDMSMQQQFISRGSLTYHMINSTPCPPTGEAWLADSALPGFGVRLRAGRKTYTVRYRTAEGKARRENLGLITVLTLGQARVLARKRLATVYFNPAPV